MLPERVSNPGPLTYESGALPIALRGPANSSEITINQQKGCFAVPNLLTFFFSAKQKATLLHTLHLKI